MIPMSRATTLLYREDFDLPAEAAPEPAISAPACPEKLYDDDDLAEACAKAAAAAQMALRAELEDTHHLQIRLALVEISRALAATGDAAERLAEAHAEAFLGLLLDMLSTLLPEIAADTCAPHARTIRAMIKSAVLCEPKPEIFLHPATIASIASAADGAAADAIGGDRFIADPTLQPGDARLSWQNGAAIRDTADLLADISAALRTAVSPTDQKENHHAA